MPNMKISSSRYNILIHILMRTSGKANHKKSLKILEQLAQWRPVDRPCCFKRARRKGTRRTNQSNAARNHETE